MTVLKTVKDKPKNDQSLEEKKAIRRNDKTVFDSYTVEELQAITARQAVKPEVAKIRFEQIARTFMAENGRLVLLTQDDNNVFYEYNNGVYSELLNDDVLARIQKHFYTLELYSYLSAARIKDAFQRISWTMRATQGRNFKRLELSRQYINMKNGLLDVSTMKMKAHTPEYFSTTQLPFEYKPSATCEKFERFAEEVSCDDYEVVHMIQEMFGYCLTVGNPMHKIFFLYGKTGRNGKSTVAKVLQSMVGDKNTSALSLQQLSGDNTHLSVALANSQINFSEEVSTKYIETTHLTNLTAEGIITVNPKNKPPYLMKVLTKFVVTCNDIPRFQSSQGMFKRQIIIPFNNSFEGKENRNIVNDLLIESEGIFNWAIEGYKRLQKQGFTIAKVSSEEMDEAKLDSNPVIEYIRNMFAFEFMSAKKYLVSQIYGLPKMGKDEAATEFLAWCQINGIQPMSRKRFAMELRRYAEDSKQFRFERSADGMLVVGLKRIKTIKQLIDEVGKDEYIEGDSEISVDEIDFK